MYQSLADQNFLFFSPALNSLPCHVQIRFWPIALIKQAGVSLWLHFNCSRIVTQHRLERLNIHSGAGGVLLARSAPVPVIVTCHHTYWQQYTYIKSQFWKRIFRPFEDRTYRLASHIVCVSQATKRALVEHYGVPEEKISVIYNAIDDKKFFPMGTEKLPHSVLYVGRIDKRKGIEFLIRSMPLIRQQIPEVRLYVGGKGAYLERMKALVQRLGLEENVEFLGFVPDEELNRLYNQVQCVVVPSMFEGFGITVIEALAAGTRVVGTDVDGIRETLIDGKGTLVPFGDRSALADAVCSLLKNPGTPPKLPSQHLINHFWSQYRELFGEHS